MTNTFDNQSVNHNISNTHIFGLLYSLRYKFVLISKFLDMYHFVQGVVTCFRGRLAHPKTLFFE